MCVRGGRTEWGGQVALGRKRPWVRRPEGRVGGRRGGGGLLTGRPI